MGGRSSRRRRYAVAPFAVDGRDGLPRGRSSSRRTSASASCALLGGLAQQAKLAIANASSYEGLERTFVSTVEALANALEANDEYTSHPRPLDHRPLAARRPRARARRARAEAARARRAAPRHRQDRHPERHALEAGPAHRRRANARSRRIRSSASGSSRRSTASRTCGRSSVTATSAGTAAAIPTALAGEDIPLESRIIFVCDAYHAMTTDRPYRKPPQPSARRCAGSREGAGTQFDPHVVEVALRVLEQPCSAASRRPRAPARRPRGRARAGGTARLGEQLALGAALDDPVRARRRRSRRRAGRSRGGAR